MAPAELLFNVKARPLVEHVHRRAPEWPTPVFGRLVPGSALQFRWAIPSPIVLTGLELVAPAETVLTSFRASRYEQLGEPIPVVTFTRQLTAGGVLPHAHHLRVESGAYISITLQLPMGDIIECLPEPVG